MKLLSFDVGIKNLAYCIYDSSSNKVLFWNIIDITAKKSDNACAHMVELLDNYKELLNCDVVLIEKQPSRNNKMRIVEGLLNAYFVIKGITNKESDISKVIVYSAKHKLGKDTFRGKSNYSQRKKLGVFRTEAFLKQYPQTDEFHNLFIESKKKDDLADSLLQALSYVNVDIDCDTKSFSENEKVISRKPSKKQERSRYSKCNLKYLLNEYVKSKYNKEDILNKISTEIKIASAIKYWYKTPDEAYNKLVKADAV